MTITKNIYLMNSLKDFSISPAVCCFSVELIYHQWLETKNKSKPESVPCHFCFDPLYIHLQNIIHLSLWFDIFYKQYDLVVVHIRVLRCLVANFEQNRFPYNPPKALDLSNISTIWIATFQNFIFI